MNDEEWPENFSENFNLTSLILVGVGMYVYGAIIGSSIAVMFVSRHFARRAIEKLGMAYYDRYMGGNVGRDYVQNMA